MRADGSGKPLALVLQPGHRHESLVFELLMDASAVKRPSRCRPPRAAVACASDNAYSNRRIRQWCRKHHVRVTIPRKADERRRGPFNKERYKLRARIGQLINRLKRFRHIAARYVKCSANYLGMVTIDAILLYL